MIRARERGSSATVNTWLYWICPWYTIFENATVANHAVPPTARQAAPSHVAMSSQSSDGVWPARICSLITHGARTSSVRRGSRM
jgi:hypothetical protein